MHRRLVVGALVTAVIVVGCSPSDSGITTAVKAKLVKDDVVKDRAIDVDTNDRVVTLTGTVQGPIEESRALELARRTRGVAAVVDHISVESGEPGAMSTAGIDSAPAAAIGGAISDTVITSDVKARLLADDQVSGLKIDVNTYDHVVTLSGTVPDAAQKSRAVELARKVDNVTRIEDNLLVRESPMPSER